MGRFKAQATITRLTPELVITFLDRYRIQVTERGSGRSVTFHRYGAPRGSYREWSRFRDKLMRYRGLTLSRCFQLAYYHGVLYISGDRPLCLNQKTVEYRNY